MTELVDREPAREGGQYDVFLSYNSADLDVVEGLARRLRTANLAVWFDRWRIPSGDDWQDHLADGLAHSDACLVFLGPHGVSDWAKQELKVAIDRAARTSYRIVPVLLPGVAVPFEPTEELPPFLRLRSWLDLRDGVEGADVVEQLVRAVKGIAPGAPAVAAGVCPYPGLRAFDEADHERFFGRDADIAQLVEKLRAHRFLAVVGPSGSGKSSLVRAGLLPVLRRQQRPDEPPPRLVVMRPGARPLAELAAQLTALGHPQPTGQLADALHDDERSWALALSTLLATSNGQIVWVVDQFEELFTLVRDGTERPFLSNLVLAAGEVDAVRIVITLRADFYARCAEHPELAQLLAAHQHLVTPLTADGWRAAVEEPAWRGGLELQAGLVPTILDDAIGRPGGLPLLQEALVATWERRAGNLLTLDGYLGGGRVAGAVARQADLAFDALTPVEQRAARAILQRLVQLGEGTADTRRQCQAVELVAAGGDEAVVGRVLQHLAAARLVTSAQDASGAATIDLSHEALITEWPRLRGWLDENREQLRVRQRLHEQATEWLDRNRDESLLYRGAQLRFAVDQLERGGLELSPLERSFLDESIADADRVEAERAAAELDRVRRRERERTRRRVLVGLSAVLVLVALVAIYAVAQSREAGRQRDIASALRLAAQSDVVGRQQTDLGLLLGLQAQDRADTVEARASVMNALSRSPRPARYLRRPDGTRVAAMALSPDSAVVVAELTDGTASLWDRATGASLGRWPSDGHGVGSATAFSPSGQLVATGYQDGSVVVRRLPLGEVVAAVGAHQRRVESVSFVDESALVSAASDQPRLVSFASGPDATAVPVGPADQAVASVAVDPVRGLLATASDGAVQVWRLTDGASDGPLQPGFPPSRQSALAWTADGATLVVNTGRLESFDGATTAPPSQVSDRLVSITVLGVGGSSAVTAKGDDVLVFDTADLAKPPAVLEGHTSEVTGVAVSPDGSEVVSSALDGVIVWRSDAASALGTPLRGHERSVRAVAFRPDGAEVTSAAEDGTVRRWDPATRRELDRYEAVGEDVVTRLAYVPNTFLLAGGTFGGELIFWDTTTGRVAHRSDTDRHPGDVSALVAAPDGSTVISADRSGTIVVWDVATFQPRPPVTGPPVRALALHPDGDVLVVAGDDGPLRRLQVPSLESAGQPLEGHRGIVGSLAFSADGELLASGGDDRTIRLWDPDGGQQIAELVGHTDLVLGLGFTTDGRLASSGEDGTVRLWDLERRMALGNPLTTATGDFVMDLAVSPAGAVLASAQGRDAVLWNIDEASWRRQACDLANRALSDQERTQYLEGREPSPVCEPSQP